jgi:hypothetical protein
MAVIQKAASKKLLETERYYILLLLQSQQKGSKFNIFALNCKGKIEV